MSVDPTRDGEEAGADAAAGPGDGDAGRAGSDPPDAAFGTEGATEPGARKRALTIPQKRLAGSPRCLNCGTSLQGPFCHYCGQPDRNFLRFFPVLLRELLEDFLDFDSRFVRTLKPLLFKPGRLTRDYLDGLRFRYTPPIRLYLFSSIAFFLLAALFSSLSSSQFNEGFRTSAGSGISFTAETDEELARVREQLDQLPPAVRDQVELRLRDAQDAAAEAAAPAEAPDSRLPPDDEALLREMDIQFNDEPWDPETNPLLIPLAPDWFNDWVNGEIAESPRKAREIEENPSVLFGEIIDLLPGTMFVLLPVVALIFKFWYLFSGRFYIEHLIFALHNHAFIYVCLTFVLLLEALESWAANHGFTAGERISYWTSYAIGLWIPVYLVVSLRTVYRQGWALTLAKAFVIAVSYLSLLAFVTGAIAVVSFFRV